MPDNLKTQGMCERAVEEDPWELKDDPYHFRTEKMCERVVEKNPWYLGYVLDQYKTEEMYNKAVACIPPYKLGLAPDDYFKAIMTQRIQMCIGITCYRLCMMFFVPDCFKTQEMCNKAVCIYPYSLEFVPGRLKTQ